MYFNSVIIGGGIIGASSLFHLSKFGSSLLIEKNKLISGSTSKSAGLIVGNQHNIILKDLTKTTIDYLQKFQNKGLLHYNRIGSTLYKNNYQINNIFDGYVDPYLFTNAYINEAKLNNNNICIKENTFIKNIYFYNDYIKIKLNDNSNIFTNKIVNATSHWANSFPNLDFKLPYTMLKSHYIEMRPPPNKKITLNKIIFTNGHYIKPMIKHNKLDIGIYPNEEYIKDTDIDKIYDNNILDYIDYLNFDNIQQYIKDIYDYEIINHICGITTYTPDGIPIIYLQNPNHLNTILHITGCNGYGITYSGGLGKFIYNILVNNYFIPDELQYDRFNFMTNECIKIASIYKKQNKFK